MRSTDGRIRPRILANFPSPFYPLYFLTFLDSAFLQKQLLQVGPQDPSGVFPFSIQLTVGCDDQTQVRQSGQGMGSRSLPRQFGFPSLAVHVSPSSAENKTINQPPKIYAGNLLHLAKFKLITPKMYEKLLDVDGPLWFSPKSTEIAWNCQSFNFQGNISPQAPTSLKALGALGAASKIDELLAALGDVSPFVRCGWGGWQRWGMTWRWNLSVKICMLRLCTYIIIYIYIS